MDATNIKVYLPFDTSTTEDLCGNEWTVHGTPQIVDETVHLPSNAYLTADNIVDLSVDSRWTFHCRCRRLTSSGDKGFFGIGDGGSGQRGIIIGSDGIYIDVASGSGWQAKTTLLFPSTISWCHLAVVKDGGTIRFFENGQLVWTATITVKPKSNGRLSLGGNSYGYTNDLYIDEVVFYDGVVLWTENFTPPNDNDYTALKLAVSGSAPLSLNVDVERKLANFVEVTADLERRLRWRYENLGTADTLITSSGVTIYDLPNSKSVTGTAFCQTARSKCFDLPATPEIWIKFDVYFDGSNRWRAYNGGTYGSTGITAQTSGDLSYFSNDTNVQQPAGICIANQLQTVLLHMISGSSDGVIEAWIDGNLIYRYTGDVNHGDDFADIYLQSDDSGTFFSNVIISNAEIGLGEGWHVVTFDTERHVDTGFDLDLDFERRVKNVVAFEFTADFVLDDILPVTLIADFSRNVILPFDFHTDFELLDIVPTEFTFDLTRAIITKLKLYPTDTAHYFSGDGVTPVTIPTQDFIPPAVDSEANVQSVEVTLSEQQITDQVKSTCIIPLDVMSVIEGEVLDYICDMRVERVTQRGILYTVDCCTDIDKLLYTQMAYILPPNTTWHKAGEDTSKKIITHYPPATEHVNGIANALGLSPVIQFDNFLSTVLIEDLGGVTYNDLIRDLFGWSSRVPTMLINVYIRNGKLFVVQRGHEANVIDISDTDKSLPTYTRELVRTTWGASPWSKTETRESSIPKFVSPDKPVDDSGEGGGGNVSGGDSSEGGSGEGDSGEKSWFALGKVTTKDSSGITVTTYYYDSEGVLQQTVANFTSFKDDKESNTKTTTNSYNSDGLMSKTSTTITFLHAPNSNSTTVTTYGYLTLPDGKKFLSTEMTSEYDAHGTLVEQRVTTKSPTGRGQGTSSNDNGASSTGADKGDDRETPYQRYSTAQTKEAALQHSSDLNNSTAQGSDYFNSTHAPDYYTYTESRTINGLLLYDSSYPIHDEATLIKITNAIKWLNRKTRETVTLSIYGFPHLIDFNDRIILDGNEYFLVSNKLSITPRLFNEQALTLTRWF